MLSIEPSQNADNALRYFRESLSVGDYYSEDQQITGQWHGKAAEQLGLYGEVRSEDFEQLLNNINPQTGKRLTARNAKNRRPMYDFTFNAPKSASLVHALTGDMDIIKAHEQAVLAVMAEVEADMQTQAGTGKGKHYVTTGNAVWAAFVHNTTRPVKTAHAAEAESKKYAPDPHLHTHCAVINATFCAQQNRFKAVEIGTIKAQGEYYEALYHAYLAQYLKQAGYGMKRSKKRWEIAGIDRSLIEKFSSRTLEIERYAAQHGITSIKAKAKLGRRTRKDKSQSMPDELLYGFWLDQLNETEYEAVFSAKNARTRKGGDQQEASSAPSVNPMQAITAKYLVDLAIKHCFARASGIAEKKLLAFALNQSLGEVSPQAIKRDLAQRKNILSKIYRSIKYITTIEMNAEEEALVDRTNAAKNTRLPLHPEYEIQDERLNQGQRAAVEHVLTRPDEIMLVSGDAGVGKTTLLQEVKTALKEKGKTLFAFAPSSDASRNVLRAKGFEQADTIASLLVSEHLQAQLQDQVMLIDEAGMIGVPTMNRLFDIAKARNARVILSGDWKQHSAVERGDALKIMETACKLPIARVTEIVRQKTAQLYKEIIGRIARAIGCKHDPNGRQSSIIGSFDALDQAGGIVEIQDRYHRYEALARDYVQSSVNSHDDVIVVAPTNAEGKAVTDCIRKQLQERGTLDHNQRTFIRLADRHYTTAQKEFASTYVMGDIVEFHQHATGFRAGRRYRVTGFDDSGNPLAADSNGNVTPLLLDAATRFSVYEEESLSLAVGDRLRITKNSKSLAGSALSNGQVYTITGFDAAGHIQLSNGQVLHKNTGHLHHGYVTTSYSAQGRDAKTVLLAQSSLSFGASDDKQFYVSVSRGHETCRIYTDDKADLKWAVSQNGDRLSAREIAEEKRKYEEALEEEEQEWWFDYRDWLRECYQGIRYIFNGKALLYEQQSPKNGLAHSDPASTCEWEPS